MVTRMKTDEFAFVEFVSSSPMELVELFEGLGSRPRGKSVSGMLLMTPGAAIFIVNGNPNPFESCHGPSVWAIGIRVSDARLSRDRRSVCDDTPRILGIGDSLAYCR